MESERTTLPSSWEKFKVVSGFLASILVPLAVGLAGHWVSAALTEKEVKMRYVELAIGILKEKGTDGVRVEWVNEGMARARIGPFRCEECGGV